MATPSAAPQTLEADGYLLLRGTIPPEWTNHLQSAFDAGVRASEDWPVPRGPDLRHAVLDGDELVQRVCRLPALLKAVSQFLRGSFFLAQVEGREPLAGGGGQLLHRDGGGEGPGHVVSALAFIDDFGPKNGATRLVPGTHRSDDPSNLSDHPRAHTLEGKAGDVLVFDAELLHGGTPNASGARRRSLLISYFAESMRTYQVETQALRGVSMPPSETFDPADC